MLRRVAVPVQKSVIYSRKMAHAKEAPKGGLEGFVATYLPKNHHVSMAVTAFYGSLIFIYNILPSKKKVPAKIEDSHAHHAPSSGEIPSIESPEFAKWLETPGNIEKALA